VGKPKGVKEVDSMPDLVPVRRGERSLAPRERPWTPQRLDPFWEPFREFDDLWNRMVSRFFEAPTTAGWGQQEWTPLVDVEETDDAWVFEVDLPGVRREDISIEATEQELSISGEIKERERVGIVRHRTRRSGSFSYRTTLPAGVDPDRVQAKFDNGVLTVRVPRPEHAKARQIKID
jgi:HSP20 family protein